MPIPVYGWPPVGVVGSEWTHVAPIEESLSGVTGARYASASEPERRAVRLRVSALSLGRSGAGYIEALKRLMNGGANLVRLNSYPINWHLDALSEADGRTMDRLLWTSDGDDLEWTSGADDLIWFSGALLTGTLTTSGGFPAVSVTGLPPSRLVARPGEFLTVFGTPDVTVQIIAPAYSDGSGNAVVRVLTSPGIAGAVSLGGSDTGVFRAIGELPRSTQPVGQNWFYDWEFIEVFSDEVGGFTEFPGWYEAT